MGQRTAGNNKPIELDEATSSNNFTKTNQTFHGEQRWWRVVTICSLLSANFLAETELVRAILLPSADPEHVLSDCAGALAEDLRGRVVSRTSVSKFQWSLIELSMGLSVKRIPKRESTGIISCYKSL